jgi:hypothetical protein
MALSSPQLVSMFRALSVLNAAKGEHRTSGLPDFRTTGREEKA